jgi:short-subunit dehydrogenase
MRRVLILGATSAIAEATARIYAASGNALFLVGRNEEKLTAVADDLRVRGASTVHTRVADLNDLAAHGGLLDEAERALGGLDVALVAHGTLPDQEACEASVEQAMAEIRTNALGPISLVTLLANRFEQHGRGAIGVITSVAGDRGRKSNYVYGAAKGAVSTFLEGVRHRMFRRGVSVTTIKPGFVDTPMTAAFPKGGPLWATPDRVARDIHRAIERGKPVLYTPWFWRWIMLVIRHVPGPIFNRTNL